MHAPEIAYIAITFADDSVGIMHFVTTQYNNDGSIAWMRAADTASVNAEIARSSYDAEKLPVKGWRPMAREEYPTTRDFRGAWRDDGKRIVHHMPAVRDIALARVRKLRQPVLDRLDRDFTKAQGQGTVSKAAAIEAERQRLRDLPAALAETLAALESVDDVRAALAEARV